MLKHLPKLPSLLTATFSEWRKDNPSLLAAALSYYAFFSIIPVLVIAAALGSFVFGQAAVDGQLASMLAYLFGEKVAAVIQSALASMYGQPSEAAVAVAVLFLLFGASYFFVQLRNSLNIIWSVKEPSRHAFKRFMEGRLLSLIMVTLLALVLLFWISMSATISTFIIRLSSANALSGFVSKLGDFVVIFAFSLLMFAMIYQLLPSVRLRWTDVWLGSAVTSLLFTIGEYFLAIYISKVDFGSVYGTAGSIAVLLLWIYVSAQLFFFGAIFTRVYAHRHGSHSIRKREKS